MKKILATLLVALLIISLLPVTTFAAGETYTKITTMDELVTGQYVMVVSTEYAPLILDDDWVTTAQPTIEGNQVTDAAGAVWMITVDGASAVLTDSNGVSIAPKSGNNNGIRSGSYSWSVACTDGTFTFSGTGNDTTILASNKSSSNKFRAYKTTTVSGSPNSYPSKFSLYLLDSGKTPCDHPSSSAQNDSVGATCTSVGMTASEKCDFCGVITKWPVEIPMLDHTYQNNACTVCGAVDPNSTLTADVMSELPGVGDKVIFYISGYAMGAEVSGVKLAAVTTKPVDGILPYSDAVAVLTVGTSGDHYTFANSEGKYLTSGATGNALSFEETLGDYGLWNISNASEGLWNIINVNAAYVEGTYNQAIEYYYYGFTTYGLKDGDAAFQVGLYLVNAGACQHINTKEQNDGYAATCTVPGMTNSVKCSDCGETVKKQEEIPASHTWGAEAYNEKTKQFEKTCGVCGETETRGVSAPTITGNLEENKTAEVNEELELTVTAEGEGELTYLWLYSRPSNPDKFYYWAEPAVDNNTIDVKATVARDGYQFKCVVTDAYGNSAETKLLALDVKTEDEIVINTQPSVKAVTAGDPVTISVGADVQGEATYLWLYNRPGSNSWYYWQEPGKDASIAFTATMARNGYSFRCVISNSNGASETTDEVTLTVNSAIDAATLTGDVDDGSFTLTVDAGEGEYTYLWLYSRPSNPTKFYYWTEPGDKTTITGTINGRDGYRFKCVVTDANGSQVTTAVYKLQNGNLEPVAE